jgi:hypothetical protein
MRQFRATLLILLAFCGMGAPPLYAQYTIGGTVYGLAGDNLVLENNGGNRLTINWDESFAFAGTVPSGTAYNVTISNLPSNPGEMCAVANGSGTVTSNVTNIVVSCFSISGTVSGLPPGGTLTLQYNGSMPLSISSDGVFTFPPAAVSTTDYNVTVAGNPSWGTCSVINASGTADNPTNFITTVYVICEANNGPPPPPSQWTPLKRLAQDSSGNPFYPGTMLLLSDGTVLVNRPANSQPQEWLRLVPDNTGSYVNGTWMSVPNSICAHGYYAS